MTAKSLGCARCGSCCDPVILTPGNVRLIETWTGRDYVPDPADDVGWLAWLDDGWAEPRETAIERFQASASTRHTADFAAEHWHLRADSPEDASHYDCDQFDPGTRLCGAGDARPPVCKNFPWYSDGPTGKRAEHLDLECSYLLDLPAADRPEGARPLIPIEVIR